MCQAKASNRVNGKEIDVNNLTEEGAWRVVSSFWRERLGSKKFKAANPSMDRLIDIVHSLGITFIGSIIALLIWLFVHYRLGVCPSKWYYFILPILICIMHFCHFRRVGKNFQSIIDIIVSDELQEEFHKRGTPTVINVAQTDLKN